MALHPVLGRPQVAALDCLKAWVCPGVRSTNCGLGLPEIPKAHRARRRRRPGPRTTRASSASCLQHGGHQAPRNSQQAGDAALCPGWNGLHQRCAPGGEPVLHWRLCSLRVEGGSVGLPSHPRHAVLAGRAVRFSAGSGRQRTALYAQFECWEQGCGPGHILPHTRAWESPPASITCWTISSEARNTSFSLRVYLLMLSLEFLVWMIVENNVRVLLSMPPATEAPGPPGPPRTTEDTNPGLYLAVPASLTPVLPTPAITRGLEDPFPLLGCASCSVQVHQGGSL